MPRSQIARGADVIYHAAGNTARACCARQRMRTSSASVSISNQNGMHPGKVLTSMLKRVDVAVEKVLTDAHNNQWKAGVTVLGLAEGAWIGTDDNNKPLITADMRARSKRPRRISRPAP